MRKLYRKIRRRWALSVIMELLLRPNGFFVEKRSSKDTHLRNPISFTINRAMLKKYPIGSWDIRMIEDASHTLSRLSSCEYLKAIINWALCELHMGLNEIKIIDGFKEDGNHVPDEVEHAYSVRAGKHLRNVFNEFIRIYTSVMLTGGSEVVQVTITDLVGVQATRPPSVGNDGKVEEMKKLTVL